MNETVNLRLPQFAETDRIHHDDFNDAFARIDTAVAANSTAITGKASTAALTAETQAREQALTAEATARTNADAALGGRIDSEAAARAAALAAVNTNLGSHGHNCRIVRGSYTGSGTYGRENQNVLTVDFHPLLVMVCNGAPDNIYHPAPLILMRPLDKARSPESSGNILPTVFMNVTWLENGVKWYAGSKEDQLNDEQIYYYVVLGYDKAAEEA